MKIFRNASSLLFVLVLFLGTGYFNPEYSSAFEADQQCHFDMSNLVIDMPSVDCDHDIETKQWILFEKSHTASIAHVIKRYRY